MSDPVERSFIAPPPYISSTKFNIAGIITTVFGLDEILPETTETACLWLLHPRLLTQACMQPFAASTIAHWIGRIREKDQVARRPLDSAPKCSPQKGLIAVSFDQRNHGSREIDKLANETWRSGNTRHAQDMFSQIHGTAADTSILLDYLAAYIFPNSSVQITQNLVFGVSLGGHAAWQVLLREPRITSGIVGIGCGDYVRLMVDRARLSKIADWDSSDPDKFLDSASFPTPLVAAVRKYDPAGRILGGLDSFSVDGQVHEPSHEDKRKVSKALDETLRGKRILLLSGGADKLVPYSCSEPFLAFLKRAVTTYYSYGDIVIKDLVYDEVGHEISGDMVKELLRFVDESLGDEVRGLDSRPEHSLGESKI